MDSIKSGKMSYIGLLERDKNVKVYRRDRIIPYNRGKTVEKSINNKFNIWRRKYIGELDLLYSYLGELCENNNINMGSNSIDIRYKNDVYRNFLKMMFINSSDNKLTKSEFKMVENEID